MHAPCTSRNQLDLRSPQQEISKRVRTKRCERHGARPPCTLGQRPAARLRALFCLDAARPRGMFMLYVDRTVIARRGRRSVHSTVLGLVACRYTYSTPLARAPGELGRLSDAGAGTAPSNSISPASPPDARARPAAPAAPASQKSDTAHRSITQFPAQTAVNFNRGALCHHSLEQSAHRAQGSQAALSPYVQRRARASGPTGSLYVLQGPNTYVTNPVENGNRMEHFWKRR